MSDIIDVFISGAGPVGLFLAYQMAKLGHSIYICDKNEGPNTNQSRAVLVTSRTMETLANHGIVQHFMKEAAFTQGVEIFSNGHSMGTVNATGDTPFPHWTLLPQGRTESVLIRLLSPNKVHRRTEFVEYTQKEDHVCVIVRDLQTGETKTIKARYLVGCDGSHSKVRKATSSWTFEGHASASRFVLADVELDGKDGSTITHKRARIFNHHKGACLIIPLGRKYENGPFYFRVMTNLDPYQVQEQDDGHEPTHGIIKNSGDDITLDQIQEVMNERWNPQEIILKDPVWISMYRINERKANGYRRGRVFLAGDAAHCHSPAGGQGMNMGLQDADNLAWKLSLVLNNATSDPELLLDSYSVEREPIAEETLKLTGQTTRYSFSANFITATFMYYMTMIALKISRVQEAFVAQLMQLKLRIAKESTLLLTATPGLIEAGMYMPETVVLRKRVMSPESIDRRTLYQIISGTRSQHILLFVAPRPSNMPPSPLVQDFWEKLQAKNFHNKTVRPVIVESTWHIDECRLPSFVDSTDPSNEEAFWSEYHFTAEHSITRRIGLIDFMYEKPAPPAALIVIRPDMYVAQSSLIRSNQDIDTAFNALKRYLH